MKRRIVVSAVLGLLIVPPTATAGDVSFDTSKARYKPGAEVVIKLTNDTGSRITFDGPWRIEKKKSGKSMATRVWSDTSLAAGETRTWRWNQRRGECNGKCVDSGHEPARKVDPGKYVAIVKTSEGRLDAAFSIGRYFTLGFDGSDATFVVFSHERSAIKDMKSEAKAEEKRLIVSGIVKGSAPYNDAWSYRMASGSIELAEAFIEVCDASPEYVEENYDSWKGERWCPWSSYVDRTGK